MVKYGVGMAFGKEDVEQPQTGGNHGGTNLASPLITSHKLNGHNYLQWPQSMMMYICGRGKDGYITGEVTTPQKSDSKFKTWKAENHMVMSWLINSMNNDIGENFLLYGTAKEILDAARETYSSTENIAELFEVEANLHHLHQGDLSVTQYFNKLSSLWQQLDMFEVLTGSGQKMHCCIAKLSIRSALSSFYLVSMKILMKSEEE